MTSGIISASESLQSAQASLAATATALSASTADLRESATGKVSAITYAGATARPRRR